MTKLRVLHLEDSDLDAELVNETLVANGFLVDTRRVQTREEFIAALDREDYDLILADYVLPSFDGISALQLARERKPHVPFLFVTGALKDDSAVETLRRGATDFIVKQRLGRLVPAVHRAMREREERTHRAKAEAALRFLAQASARLASSLDLKAILGNLTRLAIPTIADFCSVDLVVPDLDPDEQAAGAHVQPSKVELVRRLRVRSHMLPAGMAELYDVVPDERLRALAVDRGQLEVLHALRPSSLMLVPMVVNNRALGTITFGFSESGRRYDGRDLATAQNLAERAAIAVENSRLFREVQREVKARKDLLAIVSHDLRNPLQSILMTASIVAQQLPAESPLVPRLESIARSAQITTRLLSELVDLARFEAGNVVLDRRVQDIAPMVAESVELVAAQAEHKHLRIVNNVHPGAVRAYCDRTRVAQIVGNLLSNAVKFTNAGTVTITAHRDDSRSEVQISVADTGIGIPATDVPHLFDRYWQANAGGGGVGLGLSIVKALVEAHDGRVFVTSEAGRGATFTVSLPANPLPAKPAEHVPSVLIVDDDAETRISVAQVLDEAGYRTLTAGDGVEALELLRREPQLRPSLVLLDVVMPNMGAREFCEETKRDDALKDIAVIVFSADDNVAEIADELQAAGHLHKPVGVKALLDAVGHCVKPARQLTPQPPH